MIEQPELPSDSAHSPEAGGGRLGGEFPFGIVEGFYGRPWTHEQRLWMIRLLPAVWMNLYIYAPKDDPYHRERWREPYAGGAAARIRELAAACRAAGVAFNFAVSPGLAVTYGSRTDRQRLRDKLLACAEAGAAAFSLFLDDIPADLANGADRDRYRGLAAAQADFANEVRERLAERLGAGVPFLFCPTEYAGMRRTPYLEALGRELDPRIDVCWTGPRVVSPAITRADARAFGAIIDRKPFLWDNYPVNDFAPNRMFCGPFRGREAGLANELSGFAANPMNQPRASQIALRTAAGCLAAGGRYDPHAAWSEAVRSSWGAHPHAAEFALIVRLLRASPLEEDQRTALAEAAAAGNSGAIRRIEEAAGRLLAIGGSCPLITEMAGWIRDIVLRCKTVLAAREAAVESAAGNGAAALRAAREAWRHRVLVGRRHTLSSGGDMEAAEKTLLPILRESGEILFEKLPAPGRSFAREEVLLDQDTQDGAKEAAGAAVVVDASVVLDAGELIRARRIVAVYGRPWRRPIPADPPEVAVSTDGASFVAVASSSDQSVEARTASAGCIGAPAGAAVFRYLRIAGGEGLPVFVILDHAEKAEDAAPCP